MNTLWQEHLGQHGAIVAGEEIHFGNPPKEAEAAVNTDVIADLSRLGLIRISGEDAPDFLQNQFSSDVREVDATRSQLSSYCTPKGRILAAFRLLKHGDDYLMVMPRKIVDATLKRLKMFVLRSKVELRDQSDELVIIGAAGQTMPGLLENLLGSVPTSPDEVSQAGERLVVCIPGPVPRFMVIGEAADIINLWDSLSPKSVSIGHDSWRLLDIRAGLPEVEPETVEAFVPQMINLQALGGVSFKKGCYPGQEIVARTHYLGKLKRRMYRARLQSSQHPRCGEEIYAEDMPEQSAGKLVGAALNPEGNYELLAVLQIAHSDKSLHLGAADGPALIMEDLPYSLD